MYFVYFVAYTLREPTGDIFPSWRDKPHEGIYTLDFPLRDALGLIELKRLLAEELCDAETNPKWGKGRTTTHWVGELFTQHDDIVKSLHITSITQLVTSPSGTP
ncbi:MAG TPA: hypothetical protein VJ553_02585 [Candidatus Paceibacterota bacterium]|nr:hypothetical protein [Candidatus Paceibacterota bacterium]